MRDLIIGLVLGSLLTGAAAYADVTARVQAQLGQLMVANASLQDQLEIAQKALVNCQQAHNTKK